MPHAKRRPDRASRVYAVGVGSTALGFDLGRTTGFLYLEAITRALGDSGLSKDVIDGVSARWPGPGGTVMHPGSLDWASLLGLQVGWVGDTYPQGVPGLVEAAAAIREGLCRAAVVVSGQGELRRSGGGGLSPVTRPDNEFVAPYGAFTAAHFALTTNRYLHELGAARADAVRADVAVLAASIRSMGSRNPEAVLYGRGEVTADDVMGSPMITTPFHLLDLCLANEGATAIILASESVAAGCRSRVEVLAGRGVWNRQQYTQAARFDTDWKVGARAAADALSVAGLRPEDVDVRFFYDATSFEIARQFELFGYCGFGEGAAFANAGGVDPSGTWPTNTDGGLLSHGHTGWGGPHLKVAAAIRQLRGDAGTAQVAGAQTAVACGAGSGAGYHNTMVFGKV